MILPAVKTRKLLRSYSFLPNHLSAKINLPSSRPPTIPSPSYNGSNGYHNGGGPPNDYFSIEPRLSQQSHFPSSMRPGSSRSTTSQTFPHSPLYPQDDTDLYGWKDQPSLSRNDSARPPLPPKIPSQPTQMPSQPIQMPRMPEPSIPTEDVYSTYLGSGGSNGAGASMYRNESSSSYVLPPLPHKAYPPGKLVDPHTDSPSCKTFIFLRRERDLSVFLHSQMSKT